MRSDESTLAASADFGILEPQLAADLRAAIRDALDRGVHFVGGKRPLSVFRSAIEMSIRAIDSHPRGALLQRFLRHGPREGVGPDPSRLERNRLTDDESASAIAFVYAFMVPAFQGQLAELLAALPCARIVRRLEGTGGLPDGLQLYLGDRVAADSTGKPRFKKGADFHALDMGSGHVRVLAVAEVKSYARSQNRLLHQIQGHIERSRGGLRIDGSEYRSDQVAVGTGRTAPVRIGVVPAGWRLPRTFRYEGHRLHLDTGAPRDEVDRVRETGARTYRVVLRWSHEALARAAYDMTFWYMEKVGEVIYREGVPGEWAEMSPAEAGCNAVKAMLYHALLRCRGAGEEQRAVALYNVYGFGYAIGMAFRDKHRRRQMLWPEDLDEIAANGRTKHDCRLW